MELMGNCGNIKLPYGAGIITDPLVLYNQQVSCVCINNSGVFRNMSVYGNATFTLILYRIIILCGKALRCVPTAHTHKSASIIFCRTSQNEAQVLNRDLFANIL